jgi:hypothetical protein
VPHGSAPQRPPTPARLVPLGLLPLCLLLLHLLPAHCGALCNAIGALARTIARPRTPAPTHTHPARPCPCPPQPRRHLLGSGRASRLAATRCATRPPGLSLAWPVPLGAGLDGPRLPAFAPQVPQDIRPIGSGTYYPGASVSCFHSECTNGALTLVLRMAGEPPTCLWAHRRSEGAALGRLR